MSALRRHWPDYGPALLAWSCLALLPFGRLVEAPTLVMAVLGAVHVVRSGRVLLADGRLRLLLAIFAAYWLPMLLSLPDSIDVSRSAISAAAQLRFLLVGVFLIATLTPVGLAMFLRLSAWLLLFWMFDTLVQYFRGVDLFGFEAWPGRLSGPFGRGNSKFGLTLAVFVPLLWAWLRQISVGRLWLIAIPATIAFVLLAGSRAAWIAVMVAATTYLLAVAWRARRLSATLIAAMLLAGAGTAMAAYALSDRVQTGVHGALQGFMGQGETLSSNSIYHRSWIWRTALRMFRDNPVNGVGVRNFRNAYGDYASSDDPFYQGPGGETPTHSHQLLLETATETGTIGLAGLVAMWVLMWRGVARASRAAPPMLLAVAAGLAGAYFPLNTHLAVYSSYWSQILWFGIALLCVCAQRHRPPAAVTQRSVAPAATGNRGDA